MEEQKNFMIKVTSTTTNDDLLTVEAYLQYIGNDKKLKDKLNSIKKDLAYVNMYFHTKKREYSATGMFKEPINTSYNGFLYELYNYASKHKLYKKFPLLNKIKGISYVLMICCICEALKLNFISPTDYIVLEASGEIPGKNMYGLVNYYESIGFSPVSPDFLDEQVKRYVPMRAKVEKIISMCNLENVSPEMLNLLPVRMCKGMCGL